MRAYKLVLFDMDGTLIESGIAARRPYSHVALLPGRREKLADLVAAGVQIGIVTNQGGAAWGFHTEAEFHSKAAEVLELLALPATTPVAVCFADVRGRPPYNDAVAAQRRKPSGAMIAELMADAGVFANDTLYVGDRPEDEAAAQAAGVAFQWAEAFFAGAEGEV